ncbi:MAG: tRNA uridine-5-carboxymethylaminomethyl(34) synthesis enzyme MnmG [Melioribacteraceae bacterium]|nr:tRNA uridine-5-carboxymethylaminomethyl(34) synthesis enzyme MnmG [Melioribacteraceae bacterium]
MKEFDVIVIGAGHAGIEASYASAKMGCNTALITLNSNKIGEMSCNPAIGGSAKGHLVHEIDSMGGVMGMVADKTGIQFRILNKSKGPAVWAGRCQSDRDLYPKEAGRVIKSTENLTILEDSVIKAIEENNKIVGVKTKNGLEIKCKAIVVCSGTFLNGLMYTGLDSTPGGRFGDDPVLGLTESFMNMGFETGRLKTGTPPRLNKNSIDWTKLQEQPGDDIPEPFSFRTDKSLFPFLQQVPCHLVYTDEAVHKILEKGFDRSPMFTGLISGIGPRYCPSIEDKIVRFSDKKSHQLFLEPEGLKSELIYVNGFPTSLPAEIQDEAIHKIKGLEDCKMERPGYAIEYDYFPPYQVKNTLETKKIGGLYFAGQVNGTSGYEEAGGQGMLAGINAALKIQGRKEFTLKRSEAYLGVLVDDLCTKSTSEPYRMFTSRAEHRLLLRQDNSDRRLMKYGHEFGLISENEYNELKEKELQIEVGIDLFDKIRLKGEELNKVLENAETPSIDYGETISKLAKRPQIKLENLVHLIDVEKHPEAESFIDNKTVLQQVEIELKYEGYIKRQYEVIEKMEKLEKAKIPENFDFSIIKAISTEGREKLNKYKPGTIAQASRISGVTPSDISVLLVYLKN